MSGSTGRVIDGFGPIPRREARTAAVSRWSRTDEFAAVLSEAG